MFTNYISCTPRLRATRLVHRIPNTSSPYYNIFSQLTAFLQDAGRQCVSSCVLCLFRSTVSRFVPCISINRTDKNLYIGIYVRFKVLTAVLLRILRCDNVSVVWFPTKRRYPLTQRQSVTFLKTCIKHRCENLKYERHYLPNTCYHR
jgi:hypothetical protein